MFNYTDSYKSCNYSYSNDKGGSIRSLSPIKNQEFHDKRSKSKLQHQADITINWESHFLDKSSYLALADGWFQITNEKSGSSIRKGLHSLIQSSGPKIFICLYEPQSAEVLDACTRNKSPSYNLEVSAKVIEIQSHMKRRHGNFQIIFAFKSIYDYALLTCDLESNQWLLSKCINGKDIIIKKAIPQLLKPNVFYNLLIQIRDNAVTIDCNSTPIFSRVVFPDTSLYGLVGVQAKTTQFAIKNWKIKGIGRSLPVLSNIFEQRNQEPSSITEIPRKSLAEILQERQRDSGNDQVSIATNRISKTSFTKLGGSGPNTRSSSTSVASTWLTEDYCNQSVATSNANLSLNSRMQDGNYVNAMNILYQHHDKHIVDSVFREVVQQNLGVTFDDIGALETAKRLLNEAVVLPIIMPEFFVGIREPWRGVLLYGPPGTGKTLLAKAICSSCSSTFFNCSSSSLISKYRGESEKIIRCLFEAARLVAPSIIFLDEIDALVSARGMDNEHEASRRMKNELFSQMDGIASHQKYNERDNDRSTVMVLGTTNCPWDLDDALRRRLEKRIFIPLPDAKAREQIFRISMKNMPIEMNIDLEYFATITHGYSGADIHVICREASMMPIRRLMGKYTPIEIQKLKKEGSLQVPSINYDDFIEAIANTKSSVSANSISRYLRWEAEFGSS